ncbi:MAG: MBL fold metallo-hydrolase [Bacteroidales bacterium]|nr:MBL fold metallo-hydrolase [Bacteroidales bacterium]
MKKYKRMILIIASLIVAGITLTFFVSTEYLSVFGASPKGERLEGIKQSPNFDGKEFVNLIETSPGVLKGTYWNTAKRYLFGKETREPKSTLLIVQLDKNSFKSIEADSLKVTWMGHSTVLIEMDGKRILTDPVWNKRCSYSNLIGPARFHPIPIALEDLLQIDIVLISHDHYDHLEKSTICKLAKTGTKFFIPLGVGAHLEKWGIKTNQITELDWWDSSNIFNNGIELICTPARHFSGRGLFGGGNKTLWCSWTIIGKQNRVFFSGDTGMLPVFKEIGEKYGPFDITMIKTGSYDKNWPDIHLNPEQVVEVHKDLKGKILLPIHWGTFNMMSIHAWDEPIKRIIKASELNSVQIIAPKPGQLINTDQPPEFGYWWE